MEAIEVCFLLQRNIPAVIYPYKLRQKSLADHKRPLIAAAVHCTRDPEQCTRRRQSLVQGGGAGDFQRVADSQMRRNISCKKNV